MSTDDFHRREARGNATLAALPHTVEMTARAAMCNRALAAALLQLTGSSQFHDIGKFLDSRTAGTVLQVQHQLAEYQALRQENERMDKEANGEDEEELVRESWK